jgi:hypothetical protein
MRQKKQSSCDLTSEGSFESHLSTVTKNGLGMLVVLAMASTFSGSLTLQEPKFRRELGTPLMKWGGAEAKGVEFECYAGRVFPMNFDAFKEDGLAFLRAYPGGDMNQLAKKYNTKGYAHDYYRIEFQARSGDPRTPDKPAIQCTPKPSVGETLDQLQKADSIFRKQLKDFDKTKDVIVLRVWPDSFQAFRDLREILQKEGYQVGWFPEEKPIQLMLRFGGGLGPPIN